jgi:hypothetical protein
MCRCRRLPMPPRFAVRPPATVVMQFNSYLRPPAFVAAVRIAIMMAWTLSMCLAFSPPPQPQLVMMVHTTLPSNAIQPRRNIPPLSLFRELISDDDEDLRADIAAIKEQAGLDEFLKLDERICVIK